MAEALRRTVGAYPATGSPLPTGWRHRRRTAAGEAPPPYGSAPENALFRVRREGGHLLCLDPLAAALPETFAVRLVTDQERRREQGRQARFDLLDATLASPAGEGLSEEDRDIYGPDGRS